MQLKTTRNDILIVLLLLGLLLIGYVVKAKAAAINNAPNKPEKTVLIYERKPCFGFCPAYKAEIFASGQVKVTGMQHVKKTDPEYRFQLPKETVCQLYTNAEKAGFFSFPDRFTSLATDLPARELTLVKKGKPKKVTFEEVPENIQPVINQLESLIEAEINAIN